MIICFWLLILAALGLLSQSSEVRGDREGTQEKLTQGFSPPTWNLSTECLLQTPHKDSSQSGKGGVCGVGGRGRQVTSSIRYKIAGPSDDSENLSSPSSRLCPSREEREATGVWAKLDLEGVERSKHGLLTLCSQP